mgnify:CR=1 FL=1
MDIEKGIRFECQGSGNCCVSRGTYGFVYLSKKDIKKLSIGFKTTKQNFIKNYCQKTDGFIHLKELKKNNGNFIATEQPKVVKTEIKQQTPVIENKVSEEKKENTPNNNIIIKSPMIGTFYRSPNPESDPFVSEGDSIKVGQTICIVEAMKLFNDIESEVSGKIVKILVDDNSPVEYDQPLFEVDPS